MPDRGLIALATALSVRRHATVGLAVGVLVAIAAYVYRTAELLGPVRDTRGSPGLFLMLAFVLAVGIGLLVTILLTLRSAIRLAREDDA